MERTLITVPNAIPMVAVVGPHDDNLRTIEAAFPSVNITVRGNEITLRGPHIDCATTIAYDVKRHNLSRMICWLVLHIIGHDHAEPAEEKVMFALQEKIVSDWEKGL